MGTEEANGLYAFADPTFKFPKTAYTKVDGSGPIRPLWFILYDHEQGGWNIYDSKDKPLYTAKDDGTDVPPAEGWTVKTGLAPAPTLEYLNFDLLREEVLRKILRKEVWELPAHLIP